jgi:hypothetical protein
MCTIISAIFITGKFNFSKCSRVVYVEVGVVINMKKLFYHTEHFDLQCFLFSKKIKLKGVPVPYLIKRVKFVP